MDTRTFDQIVVCISGGKDSSALMLHAVNNFPLEKLICVHAVIDIDHKETLDIVRAQAAFLKLPLVEVVAKHADGSIKGFLSKLKSARIDRVSGATKEQQFPDMCNRWCTSELKMAPIHTYVRSLKGRTLVLIGERREESTQRARLEAWRPNAKLSKNGRTVVDHSPLLDLLEADIWSMINDSGMPVHPCYSQGFSRASCAICIFSSDKEIALAASTQTDIVAAYVRAERLIKHTFRYRPATKTRAAECITVEQILKAQGAWHLVEACV